MTLFDTPKSKRPRKRDELFERLLDVFHPTIPLDRIPDPIRERLNLACKTLRQYPDFKISEIMARKGRMRAAKGWTTPLALAGHWDEFPPVRTVQPGMPSQAEQMRRGYEEACHRLECENYTAACNRARQVVQLADPNVVKRFHEEWKADPRTRTTYSLPRSRQASSACGTLRNESRR